MTQLDIKFFSSSLGQAHRMKILTPYLTAYKAKKNIAVLYLLHGFSDDCDSFVANSNLARYFSDIPLIIVMPQADKSFYADMCHGGSYWQHIKYEVPQFVKSVFNLNAQKAADTFVGGVSMGGYGALKWLLQSPNDFAKSYLLSPLVDIASAAKNGFDKSIDPAAFTAAELCINNVFDINALTNSSDDILCLTKSFNGKLPDMQFFCGENDFLYNEIRAYCGMLKSKDVNFELAVGHGGHNWCSWDENLAAVAQELGGRLL